MGRLESEEAGPDEVPQGWSNAREAAARALADGDAEGFARALRQTLAGVRSLGWILSSRSDPGWRGESLLHSAVRREAEWAVEDLLSRGADPNEPSVEGDVPLECAVLLQSDSGPRIVRRLLSAGADPDGPGEWGSPLMLCASAGRTECARLLLEFGADPAGIEFRSGTTVFEAAVRGGSSELAALLWDAGGRPACGSPDRALDAAFSGDSGETLEWLCSAWPEALDAIRRNGRDLALRSATDGRWRFLSGLVRIWSRRWSGSAEETFAGVSAEAVRAVQQIEEQGRKVGAEFGECLSAIEEARLSSVSLVGPPDSFVTL